MMKTENSNAVVLKTALGGWLAGLALICLFVFGVNDPDPLWGTYWRIRPLLLTPLVAGAGAVLAYYIFNRGSARVGSKALFTVLAGGAFLVCLWLGIVLGLDGTLWD